MKIFVMCMVVAVITLAIATVINAVTIIEINKRLSILEGMHIIEKKMLKDLYKDLMEREAQYD